MSIESELVVSQRQIKIETSKVLRDQRGRICWKLPGNTPEQNEEIGIRNIQGRFLEQFPEFSKLFPCGKDGKIAEVKREEAQEFIIKNIGRSRDLYQMLGSSSIGSSRHIPYFQGSYLVAIRMSYEAWGLGFENLAPRDPRRYHWSLQLSDNGLPRDGRGRIFWSLLAKNPEQFQRVVEMEAKKLIGEGNHLDQKNLKVLRMSGFGMAITKYYPGGMESLKAKLKVSIAQKPQDYWGPETIRGEALEFYMANGALTEYLLRRHKRNDLEIAIRKYPGGIRRLRNDLEMGSPDRKPSGYWVPENIEMEARIILQLNFQFSRRLLRKLKRFGLDYAIQNNYPGGMVALKAKLGVPGKDANQKISISPEQANEQMRRILET